ncbi:MAG: hypothetical protein M1813_001276 [Trichoglossum hirsutum]|nr:MAG: hypothetical protein M1813_001276 [Trichoglossum hirsutum]
MNQAESQLYKHPKLVDELTKFRPSDVDGMSHSGLRQLSGKPGAFYQAHAVVRDTNEPEEEPQVRPARLPQPPVREGFVSGDGLQLSSSPLADTTSSPPEIPPSSPYVPPSPSETSHATYEARRKPEIATATLAFEFLSSVLSLTGPVNEATQLEFVNTPATFVSKLGASECVSINDGSLLQRGLVGTRWTTIARTVHCSVEAQAWLECNAADEVGTSRQVLAQQVGEMMGMISQRIAEEVEMTEFERTVFLIAAYQDHLRFMGATFSTEYLDYLDTSIAPTSTFLYVYQSRDYVLPDRNDRVAAAISTLAMAEFLKKGITKTL